MAIDLRSSKLSNPNNQGYEEYCSAFRGPFISILGSIVTRFEEHGEALIAAFTIVLAISTIGLWSATKKLWEASEEQRKSSERIAEQQRLTSDRIANGQYEQTMNSISVAQKAANAAELNAKGIIESERARVFLEIEEQNFYSNARRAIEHSDNTLNMPTLFVTYHIRNFGKTPAILKDISHHIVNAEELPKERAYSPVIPFPLKHFLGTGEPSDAVTCHADSALTVSAGKEVWSGKSTLWFYGYVSYEDAFERGHEHRYIWYYNHRSGGFRLYSFHEFHGEQPHQGGCARFQIDGVQRLVH